MQQLLELFGSLKARYGDDEGALRLVESEIRRTNEWIDENTSEESERSPRKLGNFEPSGKPNSTRSIFDDIDAYEDPRS